MPIEGTSRKMFGKWLRMASGSLCVEVTSKLEIEPVWSFRGRWRGPPRRQAQRFHRVVFVHELFAAGQAQDGPETARWPP